MRLQTVKTLNRATFLPALPGPPDHDCIETTGKVYSQTSLCLLLTAPSLASDGSRFLLDGKRLTGYAVVTETETRESGALPVGWSAQRAELPALIRALEMEQVNIYTDSRYAFSTIHVQGALYRERGLLSAGEAIKTELRSYSSWKLSGSPQLLLRGKTDSHDDDSPDPT